MSKPNYVLADHPMVEDFKNAGVEFLARMVGEGKYNGVIIAFNEFGIAKEENGQGRIEVDYEIVAIPESLLEHQEEIQMGKGEIYNELRKEINMIASFILGEVYNEQKRKDTETLKGEMKPTPQILGADGSALNSNSSAEVGLYLPEPKK